MIYTLTLNPSLDYVMTVPEYTTGAVNRTSSHKYMVGGKGINVSVVLSNLGCATKAFGFVTGFVGDEIERILIQQGIDADLVRLNNGISRINVKIKSSSETEINASGPMVDAGSMDIMYKKLSALTDGDYLVLAGSIPAGMDDSIYCDIMSMIDGKGVNVVVDAERELLTKTLRYRPFLIKPNDIELGDIFGKKLVDVSEIAERGAKLWHDGAVNVLVSMGERGSVLISENGQRYFCPAPSGTLVNSTGAGDSAVAGFVYGYEKFSDYKTALAYAVCAGSASAFSQNLATNQEIQSLYEKQLEKVQPIG